MARRAIFTRCCCAAHLHASHGCEGAPSAATNSYLCSATTCSPCRARRCVAHPHACKCDQPSRPLLERSEPSPHPCIRPVGRMQASNGQSGRAWTFLRPARRALAAGTSRFCLEESLRWRLTPAWQGASSRNLALSIAAQSWGQIRARKATQSLDCTAVHHYLYIASSSDRKTYR